MLTCSYQHSSAIFLIHGLSDWSFQLLPKSGAKSASMLYNHGIAARLTSKIKKKNADLNILDEHLIAV